MPMAFLNSGVWRAACHDTPCFPFAKAVIAMTRDTLRGHFEASRFLVAGRLLLPSAARPMKSSFVLADEPPQTGFEDRVVSSMSWPESRRPASSSVYRARRGPPAPARWPRRSRAAYSTNAQPIAANLQLEAVLAGITRP
jgi:hypothetical protein